MKWMYKVHPVISLLFDDENEFENKTAYAHW